MYGTRVFGVVVVMALLSAANFAAGYVPGSTRTRPDDEATWGVYLANDYVGATCATADGIDYKATMVETCDTEVDAGTCDAVEASGTHAARDPSGVPVGVCCCDGSSCITAPNSCPAGMTATSCPCITAPCYNLG